MKKALKIIGILVITSYFLGYILPNLIGVPLATDSSFQASNQNVQPTPEFISEANNKFPKSIGIINDFSSILTTEQRSTLSKTLSEYDTETTRQIVIVTIDSIAPYVDIQKYASDLGNEWGVGSTEKNNGLVIVFCNPLKQIAISTGYGTELVLTDNVCKNIIDSIMIPEFKNKKYYEGLNKGLTELIVMWK